MKSTGSDSVVGAIADLIDHGMRVSREMLTAFSGDQAERVRELAARGATLTTAARRQLSGCNCDIPPPCWLPAQLGSVTSHVCPGASASVQLRVTNCGVSQRDITFSATGPAAPMVTIDPGSIVLAPFARGTAVGTLKAPDQADEALEMQLWIRGWRDHLLRWTVKISERGCSCSHEIDVEDCPDLVHHWYDHFYCERPCLGSAGPTSG